ncbi:hypothetical protein ACFX1X_004630 [Malus domestica]
MTTEKPNRAALNPDLNRGIGGESRTLDRRTIQIGRIVPAIVVAILRWVASAFDAIDFDPLARHRYYVIGAIVVLAVAVLWRVFRAPNSKFSDCLWPFLRVVFSSIWRLLRCVVSRFQRYLAFA